jgi:hypothetical protein
MGNSLFAQHRLAGLALGINFALAKNIPGMGKRQ